MLSQEVRNTFPDIFFTRAKAPAVPVDRRPPSTHTISGGPHNKAQFLINRELRGVNSNRGIRPARYHYCSPILFYHITGVRCNKIMLRQERLDSFLAIYESGP